MNASTGTRSTPGPTTTREWPIRNDDVTATFPCSDDTVTSHIFLTIDFFVSCPCKLVTEKEESALVYLALFYLFFVVLIIY